MSRSFADDGVNWITKFGYQYFKQNLNQGDRPSRGPFVAIEKLLTRQKQSYFSTVFEMSKGFYSESDGIFLEEQEINHYGFGIKWNFGPTDKDYPPSVDYAYVLNQGSIYLKACITNTQVETIRTQQNQIAVNSSMKEFGSQYGIGYEVLNKQTGLFAEYLYSPTDILDTGLVRGGLSWRF